MAFCLMSRVAFVAVFCLLALQGGAKAQTNEPVPSFKEVSVAKNAYSLGDAVPSWVDPATVPETTSSEPVVFRLADAQLLAGETPTVYVHRALKINNAASLNSVGQIPISFTAEHQRLQIHSVSIIRGGESHDRTKTATIRFLQRETGLDYGVYSGSITALIVVNDLRVGDTIEYKFSLYGHNPVFGGKYIDWASWDQGFPIEYRRVILNHPLERKISWRMIGDRPAAAALVPKESTSDTARKLIFEERGGNSSPAEPAAPADYSALRWLQFSEFSDWNEVARWASDLFKVNGSASEELGGIIEKLRQQPSDAARVTAALEFVQSEIRYFSMALGESSHRPAQPDIVLSRRYGDCKDKSVLLLTILKELGIPGKAVLLQAGRKQGLEKQLPTPLSFNHVIVQTTIGGKNFYLDATALGQHGDLSRMGQPHEGAQVLIVDPETRGLSVIPVSATERYVSVLSEKATLKKMDGDAELEVRETWTGMMAEKTRGLFGQMSRDQIGSVMAGAVERTYPGATVVRSVEVQDDLANNTLSTVAVYRVPKFAMQRDNFWVIRFTPANIMGILPATNTVTRKDPVFISGFRFKTKYSFEIKFPENVSMVTEPLSKSVKNKHFVYSVASSFRGNRAKSDIELNILADRIAAADVSKYANDLRDVRNIPAGAFVVPKTAIKAVAGPADLSGQARNRTRD